MAEATYVRLGRLDKYGPWHVLNPESRRSWYSSGESVCGASLYVGTYRKRDERATPPPDDQKRCAKCERILNTVIEPVTPKRSE